MKKLISLVFVLLCFTVASFADISPPGNTDKCAVKAVKVVAPAILNETDAIWIEPGIFRQSKPPFMQDALFATESNKFIKDPTVSLAFIGNRAREKV